MKNTEKYISQKPDTVVQQIISIFGKKKCACGCNGSNGNIGGEATEGNGTNDHRMIEGNGEPNSHTAADLGDYYRNQTTGYIYECVDIKYENVSYSINKKQVSEALNATSSDFSEEAWPDHGYGVIINSNNEVLALYQKVNNQLSQISAYHIVNSTNDLLPAFEAGNKILILAADNTYYICTRTIDRGTPVYTWIGITQDTLSNEDINTIINS